MYAQTSDLGCFLGYSVRDHRQSEFLFGMSILQFTLLKESNINQLAILVLEHQNQIILQCLLLTKT